MRYINLLAVMCLLTLPAHGQSTAPDELSRENQQLRERIARLEKRLKELEDRLRQRDGGILPPAQPYRFEIPAPAPQAPRPRSPFEMPNTVPPPQGDWYRLPAPLLPPTTRPAPQAPPREPWQERQFNGSPVYVIPLQSPAQ